MAGGESETRRQATIVFAGVFDAERFAEFVQHRAARLDLAVTLLEIGSARMSVVVDGEPEMIEAFEMACSLGPLSCLVLNVTRHDRPMVA